MASPAGRGDQRREVELARFVLAVCKRHVGELFTLVADCNRLWQGARVPVDLKTERRVRREDDTLPPVGRDFVTRQAALQRSNQFGELDLLINRVEFSFTRQVLGHDEGRVSRGE